MIATGRNFMKSFHINLSLCLLAVAVLVHPAAAVDGTWITLNGTTPWSATSNWSGGTVADGVDSTAFFTADINGALDTTLADMGRTIGNITFTDATTDSHNMTISGANALTLDRTSGTPVINVTQSARTLTISSILAGTDGLQKNGGGALVLSNAANSYSGNTIINGGVLNMGENTAALGSTSGITFSGTSTLTVPTSAASVSFASMAIDPGVTATFNAQSGGAATAYSITSLTGNGTFSATNSSGGAGKVVTFGSLASFNGVLQYNAGGGTSMAFNVPSLADVAANIRVIGGTTSTPFVFNYTGTSAIALNNRVFELGGGAGSNLSVNNTAASASSTFTVNTALSVTAAGAKALQLGGTHTGANAFNGLIADGASAVIGVSKGGGGHWALGNTNNSYTGQTIISDGTLTIASIGDIGGGNSSIGAPTTAPNGVIRLGAGNPSGILRYTGGPQSSNRTVQVNFSNNGNTGGGSIINDGTGALTFTATTFNNSYTLGSSVTRTLTLGGTNGGTIEGAIVDNSLTGLVGIAKTGTGTWTLAGTNTNTGATSLIGGGTLELAYGTNNSNKIAGVLTLGGGTIRLAGATGSHVEEVTSTSLNAGGASINRNGANTARLRLNAITRAAGSTMSLADGTVADTDTTNTNNILGGWATVGNDWAVNSTNGADGAITALGSYTGALPSSGVGADTANYTLSGNQTQTSTVAANTVRIAGTGSGDTLALAGNALTVTSTSATAVGGILYVGGGDNIFNITNTSGAGLNASGTNDLIIHTVTGTLNVSATINGGGGNRTLIKAGAGTLVVSSANSYQGIVRVNEGVLRIANNTATGLTNGNVVVQSGAALELSNSVAVAAEVLTITGTGVSNAGALRNVASNTSSYAGAITVGNGGARINSDAGGSLTLTGGVVTSAFNNVTFGGAGNTTVSIAAISGIGGLVKDGSGVLNLNFGSTYVGATTVSAGTLIVNNSSGSATGTGLVTLASGARLGGNGTIGGSLSAFGSLAPGNSPGELNVGGNVTWNGAASGGTATDWVFELQSGNNDLLDVTGDFLKNTGSGSVFRFDFAGSTDEGTFVLVDWVGTTDFGGADFSYTNLGVGKSGSFAVVGSQLEFVVVPEPGTIVLLGSFLAILGLRQVRRRQASV
jgi:fibronectin-binding autotransporter adhesin